MRKIKNKGRRYLMYNYKGRQFDFEPGEELKVPDDFVEILKEDVEMLEYTGFIPSKVIDPSTGKIKLVYPEKAKPEVKEKPKKVKVEHSKEDLEKMSFLELKKLGREFDPIVTDRSKSKLIKELLVRLNED